MNGRIEVTDHAAIAALLFSRAPHRPLNSPGWGKLVAVKSGTLTGPDGEREQIKAGVDHVIPDHWLATRYPQFFKPCDRRDTLTHVEHRRNLERANRQLQGTTRGRAGSYAGSALDVSTATIGGALHVPDSAP